MATAAARVVVEVRAVLEEPIPYERVQLPGLYVDRVSDVLGGAPRNLQTVKRPHGAVI